MGNRNDSGCMIFVIGLLLCLPLCGMLVTRQVYRIQFNQNCGDYLKLAADANNIEIASQRLDRAIKYLEDHNLTKGNTGVLWQVPTDDLEVWYSNLKATQHNLHTFPANAGETEVSTALVKLRETLLDHSGENGDQVTTPHAISIFPNNTAWVVMYNICTILAIIGFICFGAFVHDN